MYEKWKQVVFRPFPDQDVTTQIGVHRPPEHIFVILIAQETNAWLSQHINDLQVT